MIRGYYLSLGIHPL